MPPRKPAPCATRGRPPMPAAQRMVHITIRVLPAQRAKLERNGGAELLRALIDAYPEPK